MLRDLGSAGDDEVEGHGLRWSDEDLKQAITQVESAVDVLRDLGIDDAEVEGHAVKWSDEGLKSIQANPRS